MCVNILWGKQLKNVLMCISNSIEVIVVHVIVTVMVGVEQCIRKQMHVSGICLKFNGS